MHPVGITQEALLSEDRKGTETQAKVSSSSDGSYEICVHNLINIKLLVLRSLLTSITQSETPHKGSCLGRH